MTGLGLAGVLLSHRMMGIGDTRAECTCGDWRSGSPWVEVDATFDDHVAAAILDHVRAVAADEGVRERVARALYGPELGGLSAEPREYREQLIEDAGAMMTAFLDHLDPARPSVGGGDE